MGPGVWGLGSGRDLFKVPPMGERSSEKNLSAPGVGGEAGFFSKPLLGGKRGGTKILSAPGVGGKAASTPHPFSLGSEEEAAKKI